MPASLLQFDTTKTGVYRSEVINHDRRVQTTFLKLTDAWQRWFMWLMNVLQELVLHAHRNVTATEDTTVTSDMAGTRYLASGGITFTLPLNVEAQSGYSYYFFNTDGSTISILGTINGDVLGYQLTNIYQYVEITGNGTDWYVTANN